MKIEIIITEKPKEFEPFKIEIEIKSKSDLEDLINGFGHMHRSNVGTTYEELKLMLKYTA
jgi:hypothetical protein